MRISKEQYAIARANGISSDTAYNRVYAYGWEIEKAITQPVKKRVFVDYSKELEERGISKSIYYNRILRGWDPERAATETTEEAMKRVASKRRVTPKRKYPVEYIKLAESNGVSYNMFADRVRAGWTMQDAATLPKGTKIQNILNERIKYGKGKVTK